MADFPLSQNELNVHLYEQLEFLETSADLYDTGRTSEAKRLALVLRTLLHDTRHSKSLLGLLNRKNVLFYDTSDHEAYDKAPWDVAIYTGLIGHVMTIKNDRVDKMFYAPILDDTGEKQPKQVSFDKWWSMTVIKDENENTFSRRDLVLHMADQDGGAHVDPVISGKYAGLSRHSSIGWQGSIHPEPFGPIPHPERAAVRQIAHEILRTLKVNYTKRNDFGEYYALISNCILGLEPLKIGRNRECPCGSGKKYKHCHGHSTRL